MQQPRPPLCLVLPLFPHMQRDDDGSQADDRDEEDDADPGDPVPRPEEHHPRPLVRGPPALATRRDARLVRHDEELRVGDEALEIEPVARLVQRRAEEEVLDVVVGAAEAKVRVGRLERQVGRLRELAVCVFLVESDEEGQGGSVYGWTSETRETHTACCAAHRSGRGR